jgi:hypothetical protein
MRDIEKIVQNITSKEDFIEFVGALAQDFKTNTSQWENKSIDNYLEAVQGWTEDMDGYYINNNYPIPENVNWKVFAEILIAAKMYE